MGDKLTNDNENPIFINGVTNEVFKSLSDEEKNIVLTGNNETQSKKQDAGYLGKIIGTNTKNASIHIALILSLIALVFCGLDLIHSFFCDNTLTSEVWSNSMPIVTLALGYIFGKSERKD